LFTGWNDVYAGYRGYRAVDDRWDFLNAAPVLAENIDQYGMPELPSNEIDPPRFWNYTSKMHYLVTMAAYRKQPRSDIAASIQSASTPPEIIVDDLFANIQVVSDQAQRLGFKLLVYLQPTIYDTKKKLSDYETYLLRHNEGRLVWFSDYARMCYALYRERLPALARQESFQYLDADAAIANERSTVFDDHVHFGDRGYRLVANHLAANLRELVPHFR
jgi:hypothetical protein